MVTNNLTELTEVCANRNCVNQAFPVNQKLSFGWTMALRGLTIGQLTLFMYWSSYMTELYAIYYALQFITKLDIIYVIYTDSYNTIATMSKPTRAKLYFNNFIRVSDTMLKPIPKPVHFLDYLNFAVLFDFFLWSVCLKLCNLSIGYMLVNIELAKFA